MKTYFLVMALLCGVMGAVLLWRRLRLYRVGRRVAGEFLRWELRGLHRPAHHAVVRFTAEDGRWYEVTSLSGRRPAPPVRPRYEVLYPPGAPQHGLVYDGLAYWGAPAFFLAFAAVLGLLAATR